MNKAILVLGAESSGTRLVTRLLIAAGCYGDGRHAQRLDILLIRTSLIVWRRSFPYNECWPNVKKMIHDLQGVGYEVRAVIVHRDWHATALSQISNGHAKTVKGAYRNLQRAYRSIAEQTNEIEVTLISYESLVQHGQAIVSWLCSRLGIKTPTEIEEIYDANAKWF